MMELYGVVAVSCPAASRLLNDESSNAAQFSWHTGLELCSARSAKVSFRALLTRHSSCPYTPRPQRATGSEEREGKVCRYCTARPLNRSSWLAMKISGLLRTLKA